VHDAPPSSKLEVISTATIDILKDAGADPSLVALLQCALGAAGEADIRWSSE
jgi:hypothetical protein